MKLPPLPLCSVCPRRAAVDLGERGHQAGVLPGHPGHAPGAPPVRGQLRGARRRGATHQARLLPQLLRQPGTEPHPAASALQPIKELMSCYFRVSGCHVALRPPLLSSPVYCDWSARPLCCDWSNALRVRWQIHPPQKVVNIAVRRKVHLLHFSTPTSH